MHVYMMQKVVLIQIDKKSEPGKIYGFLAQYSNLSFTCSKIRRELSKRDDIKRTASKVEFELRKLLAQGLITREGKKGHFEYKIRP